MISFNSLRSNNYINAYKNSKEKSKILFIPKVNKNSNNKNHKCVKSIQINLTDNSFEIDEVNCEKRINFNEDLIINNQEATSNNKTNEKEKTKFSNIHRNKEN